MKTRKVISKSAKKKTTDKGLRFTEMVVYLRKDAKGITRSTTCHEIIE